MCSIYDGCKNKYVVDVADRDSVPISQIELLLDGFRGIKTIKDRELCCYMISCKDSINIDVVIDWLIKHLKIVNWFMDQLSLVFSNSKYWKIIKCSYNLSKKGSVRTSNTIKGVVQPLVLEKISHLHIGYSCMQARDEFITNNRSITIGFQQLS